MKKILGILLVAFALISLGGLYLPVLRQEVAYRLNKYSVTQDTQTTVPLDTDFGIVIPKIGANARVIASVDPFDPQIYQRALTRGVAHAKGSSLPGEKGNLFIFSHSSANFLEARKYNSVFYLLTKLEIGDQIKIFYQQKEYDYLVSDKQIVSPDALSYLTGDGDSQLTLMTCWPPGTAYKRLVVQAKLK